MTDRIITWESAADRLLNGDLVVLPTDTIYGLVASAHNASAVTRVYELRQRELDKPLITLIGNFADLSRFKAKIPARANNLFSKFWPGPVSIILSVPEEGHEHIHRHTRSIAFRMPNHAELANLLQQVGPIVAPSANLAGRPAALSVDEAYGYFGDAVYYVDDGVKKGSPSALLDARTAELRVLRPAPGFNVTDL